MSISVMTLCWKTCLYEGNTLNVLLAMADWAEDDGGDIFPGIETLAAKCRCSVRTTQNALRQLEKDEVIEQIANSKGGRGKVTEYKIDLERVQELQGLHEAENADCPHCQAKRRSAEKRVQFRAQRVQAASEKGAAQRQKGAEPRGRIDNTHQHPSDTHQHSLAPGGANESESVASLRKAEPERWPEFRSTVADTWANGFPADNEVACRAEFERQTRAYPADLLIACAKRHGTALKERQQQRGPKAGQLLVKRPSSWLKEGDWQGYIPKVQADAAEEARITTAIGGVRRALGEPLFTFLRGKMADHSLAILEGVTFEAPALFLHVNGFQRTMLERHYSAIERLLGHQPTFRLVKGAATG